jgi:EmrB/QacA subfamily drug resistance transporter
MSQTTTAAERPDTGAADPRTKRNILLVFAGLMVTMLLASLDQTIFSTALPTIVGQLHGVDEMLWVTTAYILASTIMLPVYGKVGDLIGRKGIFIAAITIFIGGSIVGALATGMPELIIGRAIQGIGGGGLMLLSQAIIADVVPARERGRYMGIMGGVFALSSVAGPLLGGYFTDGPGWQWCLWMNVPLGILAILSAVFFLKLPKGRSTKPRLDYAGMGLLALASAGLVLLTTWGGTTYAWNSPVIVTLIVGSVLAAAAFVLVERNASEPIMPLHLFKQRNFNLTTLSGLLIGISMFGALGYMPTYLQMVTGANATQAGLLMIPMMAALLVTSIGSGQLVSRTGRYKLLPIIGVLIVGVSLLLLSTMTATMPVWLICVYLAIMGLGLGMAMQILILIVQNTFPNSEVGTATAANNYFRQIGASIGTAVVGSLFVSRLTTLLGERLPATGTANAGSANSFTPELVKTLPSALRNIIVGSYNDALAPVFMYMVPLMVVAAILLIFVVEKPLATTIDHDALPESLEIDGATRVNLDHETDVLVNASAEANDAHAGFDSGSKPRTDSIPVGSRNRSAAATAHSTRPAGRTSDEDPDALPLNAGV